MDARVGTGLQSATISIMSGADAAEHAAPLWGAGVVAKFCVAGMGDVWLPGRLVGKGYEIKHVNGVVD